MCCYKSVSVKFKWWGLQQRMEKFIHAFILDLFTNANSNAYCWIDEWHSMTIEDIRAMETKTAAKLHDAIHITPTDETKSTPVAGESK